MQKWLLLVAALAKPVIEPMKHDVVALSPRNLIDAFGQYRDRFPGALLYYKQSPAAVQFVSRVWDPLAKELKGLAKIGAVDCGEFRSLCTQDLGDEGVSALFASGARGFEIRLFPPMPMPSYTASVDLPLEKLKRKLLKHLPAGQYTKLETEADLQRFVSAEANIPKVLLFSEKPEPGSLWHALIHHFGDRMSFAHLRTPALAAKLKIPTANAPRLALKLKDTTVSGKGVEIFKGRVQDFSKIQEWLNISSETFARGGGLDLNVKGSPAISKPWLEEKYPELTKASHKDLCFALKGELCAIVGVAPGAGLADGALEPRVQLLLDALMLQVKKPAFKYSWVDLAKETELAAALGLTPARDAPAFIVVNPHKRLRFIALPQATTSDAVLKFIEQLKSGDARFTPLKQGIPSFISKQKKQEL